MPAAVPKTKFQDLFESAGYVLRCGGTDFDVARLAAGAKQLKSADAIGSLELQAVLALIKDQVQDAYDLYERAVIASGRAVDVVQRAMVVFGLAGHSFIVRDIYRKYIQLDEMTPGVKEHLASALGFCGWAAESTAIRLNLLESGHKPHDRIMDLDGLHYPTAGNTDDGSESLPLSSAIRSMRMTTHALADAGVSEEWIAERVGAALAFLRRHHEAVVAVRPSPVPQERGNQGLLVNFYVEAPVEQASMTEWELYAFLAETFPDVLDSESVGFALISVGSEGATNAH